MIVYLARHGEAVSVEKNPERPLSQEGKNEVEKMSLLLESMGLSISKVVHSGKKRAEESAEIFSNKLCNGEISMTKGLKPNDSVEEFWKKSKDRDDTMYVGHLPFMEKLASFILTGEEDGIPIKIKTGGVLCLEKSEERWFIKWLVSPEL